MYIYMYITSLHVLGVYIYIYMYITSLHVLGVYIYIYMYTTSLHVLGVCIYIYNPEMLVLTLSAIFDIDKKTLFSTAALTELTFISITAEDISLIC